MEYIISLSPDIFYHWLWDYHRLLPDSRITSRLLQDSRDYAGLLEITSGFQGLRSDYTDS